MNLQSSEIATAAHEPFAPLFRRSMFWTPERRAPSAWVEHIPFAFWLVDVLRPGRIVELGTHNGVSYSAMCQTVQALGLPTSCFAVDTWKGDEHAGFYEDNVYRDFAAFHDRRYSTFSSLIRSTFDEALPYFEDGSIDLLHIDGLHTYEAVRHDYEAWLPKLTPNAIVLFHDTNVRERGFGVFRLWHELTTNMSSFNFLHGHGLGVLGNGRIYPYALHALFEANRDDRFVNVIRDTFGTLGRSIRLEFEGDLSREQQATEIANLRHTLAEQDQLIKSLPKLHQALEERDQQMEKVAKLQQALEERDQQIENFRSRTALLHQILQSKSWRLTRPFRGAARILRANRTLSENMSPALSQLRRMRSLLLLGGETLRAAPRAIAYYRSPVKALASAIRILRREGHPGIALRASILLNRRPAHALSVLHHNHQFDLYPSVHAAGPTPKVSIIVPNFNHSEFLRERLDSIYNQTYKNIEVILLDDCSTDDSVTVLKEYYHKHPTITRYVINSQNSGGVFKQWRKGIALATGELVWIAESDDFCTSNLLEELVKPFANQAVMLAFSRTDFVKGAPPVRSWTIEEYLAEVPFGNWTRPFIKSANWLVNNWWTTKNIIPNVSSAVFRHPRDLDLLNASDWDRLTMCGDWIFYLHIARGGLVAYNPTPTNFYRQHARNISAGTQKEDTYYREHEVVAKYIISHYRLNPGVLEHQRRHLHRHWILSRGASADRQFRSLYDLERIATTAKQRSPNIVMAVYALIAGGGEVFPITLANMLKARGFSVTVLDCNQKPADVGIRKLLNSNIPLLQCDKLTNSLDMVMTDIGAELIHSHHAWVDISIAGSLRHRRDITHIITMHGMYELMSPSEFNAILPLLSTSISGFVYAAGKNIVPFPETLRNEKPFIRIDNALADTEISPVSRCEFGIMSDDFVLCMVARGIPEKGWDEAINAVLIANKHSIRAVHLWIIGEGPEYHRLREKHSSVRFIHFIGFRSNIRDYFASADAGFLPSRFRGESYPLVLIDCLRAGRPMLASNIGEIKTMLQSDEGMAGELFELQDWTIPIRAVADLIVRCAQDLDHYRGMLARVPKAAAKFDPATMIAAYESAYRYCRIENTTDAGACNL